MSIKKIGDKVKVTIRCFSPFNNMNGTIIKIMYGDEVTVKLDDIETPKLFYKEELKRIKI